MTTDLTAWEVHGPVRSVRREIAEWDAERQQWKAPQWNATATFRPDGTLGEWTTQNPDGSIVRTVHHYDAAGRLVESQCFKDDQLGSRRVSSYDDRGRLVTTVHADSNGNALTSVTYRYDAEGHKTTVETLPSLDDDVSCGGGSCGASVMFGVDGTEHAHGAPGAVSLTTEYDGDGRAREAIFHDREGRMVRHVVMTRDAEGRLLTETVRFGTSPFPPPSSVSVEAREELDVLMEFVFPQQVLSTTSWQYDESGRVTETVERMGILGGHRRSFQYDDRGNRVAETMEDRHSGVNMKDGAPHVQADETHHTDTRLGYEYDAMGNWTSKSVWTRHGTMVEFERANVTRRVVTYYEESTTE